MAITLIGGVFISTLLTLYVVPVTYSLTDRLRKRNKRKAAVKEAFDQVGDINSLGDQETLAALPEKTAPAKVLPEKPKRKRKPRLQPPEANA
ncbi:Multidrug resistance protein MdtC [compost metagenome]